MKVPAVELRFTAYSYLRFSSPEQAEGDSSRRQTALRDGWLRRHPEVRLDRSLALEDRGVSGYRGAHRTDPRHALARFLDLVKQGRVVPGSYLIVENLDRLSREHPLKVIELIGQLTAAGVRVVQLEPEVVFTADMGEAELCLLLVGSFRGHGESKRKSDMISAAWNEKKEQARSDRTPYGRNVPAWLELTGQGYRVREDRARAVRLIFQWCAEGLGSLAITTRLGQEKIPPIGRARKWQRSYVAKILDNRAVLGEYQPMKGHRDRQPDGDPVPDFFPRVIDLALWEAAHRAIQGRNGRSGRPGKKGTGVHVFQGMVYCAQDDCPLHAITRKGRKFLVSAQAAQGASGAHWQPFPLDVFQDAVLGQLRELRPEDLFGEPAGGRVAELTGKLALAERRLKVASAKWEADPESPTWADAVTRADRECRALRKEREEAQREQAAPLSGAWADVLAQVGREQPERLRAALLATIDQMRCVIVGNGTTGDKVAAVQVWFKADHRGQQQQRSYLVIYRCRGGGQQVLSLAEVMGARDSDLRNSKHARALARALSRLDLRL